MDRILAKRAESTEFDAEMMQLTAGVLQRNPDVSTLWNIRRECLLKLKESDADNVQEVFDKDLSLTRTCLEVNPKSYCAWHHRCWILENTIEPNWQREVNICTEYLKKDERNCMYPPVIDSVIPFLPKLIPFPFWISSCVGLPTVCSGACRNPAREGVGVQHGENPKQFFQLFVVACAQQVATAALSTRK